MLEAIGFMVLLAVGVGALLWWGGRLPPTRPRPRSRNRGETLMSVHNRYRRGRR